MPQSVLAKKLAPALSAASSNETVVRDAGGVLFAKVGRTIDRAMA